MAKKISKKKQVRKRTLKGSVSCEVMCSIDGSIGEYSSKTEALAAVKKHKDETGHQNVMANCSQ